MTVSSAGSQVVKINALEVPDGAGEEIVKRFTARLEGLAEVPGFEGFELLRPTGEAERRWFVYTRWADEAAYEAWRSGDAFAAGHRGEAERPRSPVATGATLLEFEVAAQVEPGR